MLKHYDSVLQALCLDTFYKTDQQLKQLTHTLLTVRTYGCTVVKADRTAVLLTGIQIKGETLY